MNHPPSPSDRPLSSVMSELDSLSDSDWLDIASGRDSDDNDSLSDQDSDRDEISSMPRSRRSSISNEDSVSSDVEAWEGFVSDSGDEAPEAITGMYTVPHSTALGAEPLVLGFDPIVPIVDEATAEEDQRVREALDQSFVGTLSASARSATGSIHSTHTSIRDLRLSFPDPLTSSRDELNRSYETVSSPTETTITSSTDDDENDLEPELTPSMFPSPPIEDPGLLSTTPAVQHHEVKHLETEEKKAQAELEIVLYGTSSEIKWKFVQELIQTATTASGHVSVNTLREDEQFQSLRFIKNSNSISAFFNAIDISDRTNGGLTKVGVDNIDRLDCPSLAVVYLPTAKLPVLAWHDAYLPVVVPNSNPELDNTVMLQSAEDDWDLLAIPPSRVIKLGANKSPIFNPEDLVHLSSLQTLAILRGIGRDNKKISALKPLTEQVKSVNAVTLFALMSIIMGFAFNTAFRPPTPSPTPTVNTPSSGSSHAGQLWGLFATQPNRSIVTSSVGCTGSTSASGSLKEMALSVFNPGSTSLSVTPPPASKSLSVASSSKEVSHTNSKAVPATKCQQCTAGSSGSGGSNKLDSDKARASTDVAVRSTTTSLSEVSYMTPSVSSSASHTGSGSASGSGSRSGTSIVLSGTERLSVLPKSTGATPVTINTLNFNTVSEAFDATTKALVSSLGSDLASTLSAADDLLSSLRAQTDLVIRSSKGKARALSTQIGSIPEKVEGRNRRAKRKARELRERGEEMVRGVTVGVRERTVRARRRARELGGVVVEGGVEVWKSYERAQGEWESALKGKEGTAGAAAVGTQDGKRKEKEKEKEKAKEKENVYPVEVRGCWKDKLSVRRKMRKGLDYL